MSNPWNRASPAVWPLGPNQSTDNFSGLPSGQAKGLGVISPTALSLSNPLGDIILPPWKITLTSSPSTGGSISRYLLFSEDDVLWPGNISPTSTSNQEVALAAWLASDTAVAQVALIDALTTQSGQTLYQTRWQTIRGLIGNVPTYCSILVYNDSSVAFASYSSGNQSAEYVVESYN
jgi:hypothetical protein